MITNQELKVIDLFAGAGGFGLGFHLAGCKVICSVEVDKWAAETLEYNQYCLNVVNSDIKDFSTLGDMKQVCNISPDIIIGGPPCQGFSIAGPAHKKDPKDPRNSLFQDFARWVKFLQPQIFIMENVKGILSRKNADQESVIEIIIRTFQELGYFIEIWCLDAVNFGVPQTRERIFIVGNKLKKKFGSPPVTHSRKSKNNNLNFAAPELHSTNSIGDAILDLPILKAGEGQEAQEYTYLPTTPYQRWARGNQKYLYNHVAMKHTKRIVERFKLIQEGSKLAEVPEEYKVRQRNGNGILSKKEYNSNYRHLKSEEISYTIPASFYSSFIHPNQPRNITAREAARIQSFPDWYRFMGKRTIISSKLLQKKGRQDEDFLSQYNQIGNAVPPLLAYAIADHIKLNL